MLLVQATSWWQSGGIPYILSYFLPVDRMVQNERKQWCEIHLPQQHCPEKIYLCCCQQS